MNCKKVVAMSGAALMGCVDSPCSDACVVSHTLTHVTCVMCAQDILEEEGQSMTGDRCGCSEFDYYIGDLLVQSRESYNRVTALYCP